MSDPGSVVGRKIAVGGRDVPVLSVGEAGVETFFEEMTVTGFENQKIKQKGIHKN